MLRTFMTHGMTSQISVAPEDMEMVVKLTEEGCVLERRSRHTLHIAKLHCKGCLVQS